MAHSFPTFDIGDSVGEWDCTADEMNEIDEVLSACEPTDMDRLIQLCDAIARGDRRGHARSLHAAAQSPNGFSSAPPIRAGASPTDDTLASLFEARCLQAEAVVRALHAFFHRILQRSP